MMKFMKTNFYIIILFNTLSFFSILHSCQGRSVYEDVGTAHPFGHPTEKRHNIFLHISGKKFPTDDGNENIWFLITETQESAVNINTMKTNHTTKKLSYDSQTKTFYLVGHKYRWAQQGLHESMKGQTHHEISQIITPRTIVFTQQGEIGSCGFNPKATLNSNESESVYMKLEELYKGKIVQITARRFRADRSKVIDSDPQSDNFPNIGDLMIAYLDLRESSQPQQQSPNLINNSSNSSPQNPSFFTFNKIVFIGFVSLGAIFWYLKKSKT